MVADDDARSLLDEIFLAFDDNSLTKKSKIAEKPYDRLFLLQFFINSRHVRDSLYYSKQSQQKIQKATSASSLSVTLSFPCDILFGKARACA